MKKCSESKLAQRNGGPLKWRIVSTNRFIRSLILAGLIQMGYSNAVMAQEVLIPDSDLNSAIREALQKPVGPITQQDMLDLTILDASGRNIKSLQGLEAAHHLTTLNIEANGLTALALPNGLTNLIFLDLADNLLTNLTLSADLGRLNQIDLEINQLTSVAFPAGLANLAVLNLEINQLASLTLPPDMGRLTLLLPDGNPLNTLVLSELAATNLPANLVASLQSAGISVFTYPLTVQLIRLRQPIGAFQFAISGPPGAYTVLGSTNLADWIELGILTNSLGKIVFTDGTAHLSAQKFYRTRPTP